MDPSLTETMNSMRFAIVVSRYNESITEKLVEGALRTFEAAGIERTAIEVVRVPGAWEIPLATQWLIDTDRFTAVVTLGAVIKGETSHDEHINRFVSLSVGEMALESGVPIAFGLLTCNTLQQAVERSGGRVGNKGEEATEAVLEMLRLKTQIQQSCT